MLERGNRSFTSKDQEKVYYWKDCGVPVEVGCKQQFNFYLARSQPKNKNPNKLSIKCSSAKNGIQDDNKRIRELNVYGIGVSLCHQTGFNHSYYERMGTKSEYLTARDTVKSFAQVVQYGLIGEEFMSEQELMQHGEFVVNIACGERHSLFVTNLRRVFCCGDNSKGSCAKAQTISLVNQVTLIPELSCCNIVEAKCGALHSLFISEGYECVYVSGYNTDGECGLLPSTVSVSKDIYGLEKMESIEGKRLKCVAPGAYHTVFVTADNCVYTSGYCAFGSLGQGYLNQHCSLPVKVDNSDLNGLRAIKTAACGQWHTIVITEDGSAYSWGYDHHGQCGLNSSSPGIVSPVLVTGLPSFEKVVDARCGNWFTIFRTESNNFYGCGDNSHGALGLPTIDRLLITTEIPLSIGSVLDYSCGANFTVFTTKDGGAYTCGYRNTSLSGIFQFTGDSLFTEMHLPRVSRGDKYQELHVSYGQTCSHIMLYTVPKIHFILSNKLFAVQQKGFLCDITVVFEE